MRERVLARVSAWIGIHQGRIYTSKREVIVANMAEVRPPRPVPVPYPSAGTHLKSVDLQLRIKIVVDRG